MPPFQVDLPPSRMTLPVPAWCIDDDTRDNVIARRNVLAALWAGRLMGLSEAALTAYAIEVHLSDFELAGDRDVVDKLAHDLHRQGQSADCAEIRNRLRLFHAEALRQIGSTD